VTCKNSALASEVEISEASGYVIVGTS
jgi:hypothetical protein